MGAYISSIQDKLESPMFLDRKIAIVTGSTAGLGLVIARELASNGATVIITSRKKPKLKKANHLDEGNFYGF